MPQKLFNSGIVLYLGVIDQYWASSFRVRPEKQTQKEDAAVVKKVFLSNPFFDIEAFKQKLGDSKPPIKKKSRLRRESFRLTIDLIRYGTKTNNWLVLLKGVVRGHRSYRTTKIWLMNVTTTSVIISRIDCRAHHPDWLQFNNRPFEHGVCVADC